MKKSIYLRTFGWPMDAYTRDGIGIAKEDNWLQAAGKIWISLTYYLVRRYRNKNWYWAITTNYWHGIRDEKNFNK